jgi:hypothetical protein
MLDAIRAVVRRELAGVRGPALGAITKVHPHASDGDDFNDEVDVTLQHEKVELPRVPVAVGFPGTAVPLKVGDVVLVQFLGGDLQQPLVTACFHTADARPPVRKEGELVVEQRDGDGTAVFTLLLDADGNLTLTATDTKVTITCATLTVEGDVTVKDGKVTLTKGDLEVSDGTVKAIHGSGSTTIDGHKITGS